MKMNKEVVMVRISDIIPNRFQPRLTFDEEALNELANSIKEHGIIQPLILRDLGSKYEIIAGERRYKASQIAGLTEVPAIIGSMDDQTSAELALIENIQRKDLSAIEEAKSYKIILDMGNFTQDELAKRMGKSQSTIANKMRLLSLTNEVQMALMNNLISERHARCLLQIKDTDKQKDVLNKVITERMNVRDTDDYIKNMLGITKMESTATQNEQVQLPQFLVQKDVSELNYENNKVSSNVETYETKQNISSTPVNIEKPLVLEKLEEELKEKTNATIEDNPNVYTQSNNNDFVNISNLDKEEIPSPVKAALNGLNVISTESEIFDGKDILVEEKDVQNMPNTEISEMVNQGNNLMKIKLATAIKLVKDSTEEIKKAGYNLKIEEIDNDKDYQIIIKIQK